MITRESMTGTQRGDDALRTLDPGDVHVWSVNLDEAPELWPADSESHLSLEEQERCARLVFEKDRRLFRAAHLLVRSVLSRYADVRPGDWQFATAPGGKPRIGGPSGAAGLRFNLSHTRGLAVVAVAAGDEIGVDVERITTPVDHDLARTCFSADEVARLLSTPTAEQPERFFEIWTLKEAYLKARGSGLALPLKAFSMHPAGVSGATVSFAPAGSESDPAIDDDAAAWQFHRRRLTPRHALAVAVRRPAPQPMRVAIHEWRR